MKVCHLRYVRFVSLHISDYGVFTGPHDWVFDHRRTLIYGRGGTGKTTIARILSHLGATTSIKRNHLARDMPRVRVETSGERGLIKKYASLIFMGENRGGELIRSDGESWLSPIVADDKKLDVRDRAQEIFQTLLRHKPGKGKVHRNLEARFMAGGERVCLGYAFVFAIRQVLGLDIPAVFDSPYMFLDSELRRGLSSFMKGQTCQQILLDHPGPGKDKPHYCLDFSGRPQSRQ